MSRRRLLLSVLFVSLFTLTSCDMMNTLKGVIPKFDGNLPNNIAGSYAYFRSDEEKTNGEYSKLYKFNSKENTFTETVGTTTRSGSYTVSYKTYAITECNGTLTLRFDTDASEIYDFYFYATAVDGPEYLRLADADGAYKIYYYWGN